LGAAGRGGNFGVVTRFEFQLHPVGPNVLSGLIVFPFDQAKLVITQFARFTETMPEELNVWMVTRKAPPLPFLPEDAHGKEMVALALCYVGDPKEGEKLIEPPQVVWHGARRAYRRSALHRLAAGIRSPVVKRGT
jgi:FAD/FMN-containing dehydrogenase